MLYCTVCKCHHSNDKFTTRQRRKPASVRVCKTPTPPYNYRPVMHFSSFSDYCDYLEFGRVGYCLTEVMESYLTSCR